MSRLSTTANRPPATIRRTGNFTKIVQRVGVRIRLDPQPPERAVVLRPGLSITAVVRLR